MIKFLNTTYAPAAVIAPGGDGPVVDKCLDQMTGPELLALHNLVASNLGKTGTKRFSDTETARRRTWAILELYDKSEDLNRVESTPPTPDADKPVVKTEAKPSRRRFVFAPDAEVKEPQPKSARAKALALLRRPGGATFEEVQAATGWNDKRAYEGIRILHYFLGWGLRQIEKNGVTRIEAYKK